MYSNTFSSLGNGLIIGVKEVQHRCRRAGTLSKTSAPKVEYIFFLKHGNLRKKEKRYI